MLFSWWERGRRQQWNGLGSTSRRSIQRGGTRRGLIDSASNLVAVGLISLILMSMFMNRKYSRMSLSSSADGYSSNGENHKWVRPSNSDVMSIHYNNSNSYSIAKDLSQFVESTYKEQIGDNNKKIDLKDSRLPETMAYLKCSNSTFRFSAKDLRSAYIYKRGPWDGAGIVIEEYKLVFFTQGKVACTVFKQLFRRMIHMENWMVINKYLPHHPQKNGLAYLYDYSFADALTILTHPEWTRAIFVRDPKERTLSAFLDKAARKNGAYIKKHCCNTNHGKCGQEANASFLGFLRVVIGRCCCDPHWRPQTKRIDKVFMPFINFVGHFDRIQEDTKRLLQKLDSRYGYTTRTLRGNDKIDVWETFGASGWGDQGNESIFGKNTKAKHQTSAKTKLRQYYNATSEALVEKMFSDDYRNPLLNLTLYSVI